MFLIHMKHQFVLSLAVINEVAYHYGVILALKKRKVFGFTTGLSVYSVCDSPFYLLFLLQNQLKQLLLL